MATLEEAAIAKATALVVAVADPFEARRIVETARSLRPEIQIMKRMRTMTDEELDYLMQARQSGGNWTAGNSPAYDGLSKRDEIVKDSLTKPSTHGAANSFKKDRFLPFLAKNR